MSNNPEFSNTNSSENGAWGNILPKDNFYQHKQSLEEAPKSELSEEENEQIPRTRNYSEQLENKTEAKKIANRVVARLLAVAITFTALMGGLVATSSKKDILKSEQARQKIIEMQDVKEIVFYGNVRNNPEIPNPEDPSNIHFSVDDEVRIKIPEGSKILYFPNDKDPNGGWYAVPANLLKDESFVSSHEAHRLEKDHDGYVWINHNNASIITGSKDGTL